MADSKKKSNFSTEQVTKANRSYFYDANLVDTGNDEVFISAPGTAHPDVDINLVATADYRFRGKRVPAIKCFGQTWLPWNQLCTASGDGSALMNYRIMNSTSEIPVLRFNNTEDMQLLRERLPRACHLGPNATNAVFIAVAGLPHIFAARAPTVPPHIRALGPEYVQM